VGYTTPPYPSDAPTLADDGLEGAGQLAAFFFGEDKRATRRRVYRMVSEVPPEDRPPVFRLGDNILRARRSTLMKWIEEKEAAATRVAEDVTHPAKPARSSSKSKAEPVQPRAPKKDPDGQVRVRIATTRCRR
jgi:hypothetical protein